MIVGFKNRSKEFFDLLEVIEDCKDDSFYFTHNNERLFITNSKNLNTLLKESHHIYYENEINAKGIILIWESVGGDVTRNYIKIVASDSNTVRRLLTMLLWNYNESLCVKIKKGSPHLSVFKEKGFKFLGSRGTELLLEKSKFFKR